MFVVDETTKQITMHRGDTGTITFTLTGFDFSNVDAKAIFSMKRNDLQIKEEVHDIDEDNEFVVEFRNADTDGIDPGTYEYDIRIVIDPVYDQSGSVIDGEIVYTPEDPIAVNVKRTIGII